MKPRLREIQRRRAALVALSDMQRANLVLQVERWERPLAFFDAGFAAARALGRRPIVVLFGVALLARSRWPRLGTLLERASIVWQVIRTARNFWSTMQAAGPARPGSVQDKPQGAS